ncbi:MAG: YibE/F family protein [Lawsonella sp.]
MAPKIFRGTTVAHKVVAILLAIMAIATVAGLAYYWPSSTTMGMDETMKKSMGYDDELVYAEIVDEGATSCTNSLFGTPLTIRPEYPPETKDLTLEELPEGQCPAVTARIVKGEGQGYFVIFNNRVVGDKVALEKGQTVRLAMDTSGDEPRFVFEDMDRRVPLAVWIGITALLVIMVGSWKGLRALIGVVITLAVVVLWILPSIMSGNPAMTVAVVGAAAALFIVMFFVHGFSWKTASALLATLISVLGAVAISRFAVLTTHITGMAEEQNVTMQMYMQQLPIVGLLIAGFIIGTIGVLNDVTISQAATVFELVEMDPKASPSRVFDAAMRVGRDHISSMLYTLVLAYTGSVLPLLLFIQQSSRGMWEVLNGETIAVEIIRSLVGVIALTFCFPLTNAIAIWLAKPRQRIAVAAKGTRGADDGAEKTAQKVTADKTATTPAPATAATTERASRTQDTAAGSTVATPSTPTPAQPTTRFGAEVEEEIEEVEGEIVDTPVPPRRPTPSDTAAGRRARRISPSYVDSRLLQGPDTDYKPRRSKDDDTTPPPNTENYKGRRRAD